MPDHDPFPFEALWNAESLRQVVPVLRASEMGPALRNDAEWMSLSLGTCQALSPLTKEGGTPQCGIKSEEAHFYDSEMSRLAFELPVHGNAHKDLEMPEDGSFGSLAEIRRLFSTESDDVLLLGMFQRLRHCGLERTDSHVEALIQGKRCPGDLKALYDEVSEALKRSTAVRAMATSFIQQAFPASAPITADEPLLVQPEDASGL